ncbi:hypothetical protein, conserved [Angomonas deanei]|uniref:Uncharacterized protein n=1 Tax=Angomonas deanei TaxID=59799 RepID=A0A7G2CFG2_9TRYP|nr:hypothetical protein, conserved [Angomonas deanei]
MVPTLVQEEVRQQLGRQAFCTTAQLDSAVADLRREAEALGEQLSGLKGTMDTHATTRDGMEARLAAIDAQLRETAGALADRTGAEGLAATQQWTKKNLQRLKERTEHLSSQMEEVLKTQKRLDSDITVVDAKTDGVNKKLRRMLQQKATEADALKALLEKELNHVREVADEHEVLRNTGATYGELKF